MKNYPRQYELSTDLINDHPLQVTIGNGRTLIRAGLGKRLGARLLDYLFVVMLHFGIGLFALTAFSIFDRDTSESDIEFGFVPLLIFWILFPIVHIVYEVLFTSFKGTTPGKSIVGIAVVDYHTGEPPKLWNAIGRYFVFHILFVFFIAPGILMALSPLFHNQRRGWHDLMAETTVIDKKYLAEEYQ